MNEDFFRPPEVHSAIYQLFHTVPIGQGANLNMLVNYIERLERERNGRSSDH